MVNQTMQAFGMLNEERDDPTLKIPIQEGSTVPIQTTPVEKEPKLELPKEIEKQISTKKSKSILRPRARPEGLKINRQSPIDKVLELDYLLKGKPTRGSKTTQIISNLYEGKEDDQKAIKGFMDSAAGGDTGYDPTIEAWCAAFVAHILEQLGADPLKSKDRYDRLRANAYRNYGSAVDPKDIREGDIVVFDFDKDGTGDHVTFYAGDRITSQGEGNYINIVGGNHGRGEVSIRENHPLYIWDNVLATRRITYNDIDFEFTQEMAKQNPVFNKFLPEYAQLKTDAPATYSEGGLETGDANFKIMQEGFRESQAKRLEKNIEEAKETGKFLFESLPGISTAVTAQDITEELQKENPSYGKIALLGGSELIGLIPGLGAGAKAGLRAAAKKIGFDKVVDAIDAVPTDAPIPKPADEIFAAESGLYPKEKSKRRKSNETGGLLKFRKETGRVPEYSLPTANDMKIAGKTNEEIEAATGLVYDDAVDMFRFEIDDSKATIKFKPKNVESIKTEAYKVEDFLDHPELFSRYPKIKDFNLVFKNAAQMDGANGYFSASTNSVVLNTNLFKKSGNNTADVLDTLFHELQHGVQFIENFKDGLVSGVRGSNKSSIAKQGKDKLLIKLRERLIKATEEYDLLVPKPDVNDRLDITRMIKALSDPDIIKKQDELKQIIGDSNAKLKSRAFELYLKNLGEAESRVVGAQARPNSSRNQSFLSARSDQEKLQGEIKGTKRTGQDLVTENLMQNLLPFSTEKELSAVFGGKWDILLKDPMLPKIKEQTIDQGIELGRELSKAAKAAKEDFLGKYKPKPSSVSSEALTPSDTSFTTSSGSTYNYSGKDSTTVRNRAPRNDNEVSGPQPRSGKTIFMTREAIDKIGGVFQNTEIPIQLVPLEGNKAKLVYSKDYGPKKAGEDVSGVGIVEFTTTPAKGLHPVEIMSSTNENRRNIHFGNEIIDIKESQQFAQGGSVMNNQMEMAFMQQGGLKDDGMRKDPVSGNPIPNGSMAEEVRDDIPAQLSEGEYVVPADVVRYYGVKHFEDIRNNAKQGLQSMEANGRIGGEPVPVGGPKAAPQQMPQQQQVASDLSQDEMNELQSMMMNVGGFVNQPTDPYQQQQTMYQPPMVMGAQAGTLATNNPTLFATTPSTISSGFSFEPPQQAAPAVDQAAKDAAETAKGTADCAAKGMDYDPVTKTCKPKTPQVTSGGDDGPAPTETPDPNAWMGEYDYTDPAQLSEQITAALTTSKGQPSGIFGLLFNQFAPVGGLIDMVSKGTNAAKQAANIQLLEANGKPTGDLKILLEKYITDNRLTPLENLNLISGDGFYKTLIAEKGENPFGPGTTKTVVKQRTPRVITDKEKAERKKIASDLQAANKKRSSSKDKDPFASLTAAQQTSVGSASQGTASGQASAEAKAKAAGVDVKNLKGKDDEDYNLSGSGMVAGSNVGAGTGGVNYSGPMNKGGLATRRKTKGK